MQKQISLLLGIIIAIITLVAGFFGGIEYSALKQPAGGGQYAGAGARAGRTGGAAGAARFGGTGAGAAAGGFTTGKVISKDATSITVQMQDGSSKVVLITSGTKYSKMVDGTTDDIAVGKNVIVSGDANSDGSITAQNVQLRTDAMMKSSTSTPAK